MGKIFGIGLSGTGTNSLCKALEELGYPAKHYPLGLEDFDRYEAFADTPVNVLTGSGYDPVTHTAELKVCPVRVEPE